MEQSVGGCAKNDERKILSIEMGWLRRIIGVSRLKNRE